MRARSLAVVVVLAVNGCALTFDESRYSENFGTDATIDSAVPVVEDTLVGVDATDTAVAMVDTAVTDTACTSLDTVDNCGACGNSCRKHGPSATCVGGKCECPGDRCPATGDTFVCTNRSEDPLNCGTCGNKCADGEYCKGGGCDCMPPLVRCSSTSGCIDVGGHHEYCGSCTLRCSAADNTCRATAPLSGYKCTLDSYGCPTGRTHCYGDHCFDTKIDETNCGGCGFKCASNQVCVNGVCRTYTQSAGKCGSGEADCSPLPGNSLRMCVTGGTCPG